ncbi:hypothetical protein LJR153_007380 [Paenibacillus sp. LjRoot153]|uniref:hypothetical protein n=1 Tax=Paenibacillus sp. LjRoot153 TaxID=3342270 RepID=UPI003ECEF075
MYDESFITDTVTRQRFGEMDLVTRSEADKLYKKIIGEVYRKLKNYGFKKKGSVSFVRLDNEMFQIGATVLIHLKGLKTLT